LQEAFHGRNPWIGGVGRGGGREAVAEKDSRGVRLFDSDVLRSSVGLD